MHSSWEDGLQASFECTALNSTSACRWQTPAAVPGTDGTISIQSQHQQHTNSGSPAGGTSKAGPCIETTAKVRSPGAGGMRYREHFAADIRRSWESATSVASAEPHENPDDLQAPRWTGQQGANTSQAPHEWCRTRMQSASVDFHDRSCAPAARDRRPAGTWAESMQRDMIGPQGRRFAEGRVEDDGIPLGLQQLAMRRRILQGTKGVHHACAPCSFPVAIPDADCRDADEDACSRRKDSSREVVQEAAGDITRRFIGLQDWWARVQSVCNEPVAADIQVCHLRWHRPVDAGVLDLQCSVDHWHRFNLSSA